MIVISTIILNSIQMSKIKILIVEDESIVAMDIKHRAEGLGYQVIGVTPSGEEALELVRENPPDLISWNIVLKGKWTE